MPKLHASSCTKNLKGYKMNLKIIILHQEFSHLSVIVQVINVDVRMVLYSAAAV